MIKNDELLTCVCTKFNLSLVKLAAKDKYCPICGNFLFELSTIENIDALCKIMFLTDENIFKSNFFLKRKVSDRGFNNLLDEGENYLRLDDDFILTVFPKACPDFAGLEFGIKFTENSIIDKLRDLSSLTPLASKLYLNFGEEFIENVWVVYFNSNRITYFYLDANNNIHPVIKPYIWEVNDPYFQSYTIILKINNPIWLTEFTFESLDLKLSSNPFENQKFLPKSKEKYYQLTLIPIIHGKSTYRFRLTFKSLTPDKNENNLVFDGSLQLNLQDSLVFERIGNGELPIQSYSPIVFFLNTCIQNPSGKELIIEKIETNRPEIVLRTTLPIKVTNEKKRIEFSISTFGFERNISKKSCLEFEITTHDNLKRIRKHHETIYLYTNKLVTNFLAIDWGTTNTCLSLKIERFDTHRNPNDLEFTNPNKKKALIPSQFGVKNIDPKSNEIDLVVGNDNELSNIFNENPSSLIYSFKRIFFEKDHIFLCDLKGFKLQIETTELLALYLEKLILNVENAEKCEFVNIGFSYPSKLKNNEFVKFKKALSKLHQKLADKKTGLTVHVLPGNNDTFLEFTSDEATSIAIDYLKAKRPEKNTPNFLVYDFGGGTIDSALFSICQTDGIFHHSVQGIGGNAHFGGDDVSRCIVDLIRKKISSVNYEIKIPIEGFSKEGEWSEIGSLNKIRLMRIAEKIKIGLSNNKECFDLNEDLNSIFDIENNSIYQKIQQCNFEDGNIHKKLKIWKNEIYDSELVTSNNPDLSSMPIKHIIENTIEELKNLCEQKKIGKPNQIILAGQSSNLPIVKILFLKYFPFEDVIDFNRHELKSRLSNGLCHFLDNIQALGYQSYYSNFFPPNYFSHYPIGIHESGEEAKFSEIIPSGTALNTKHYCNAKTINLSINEPSKPFRLFIKKYSKTSSGTEFGYFDFKKPCDPSEEIFSLTDLPLENMTGEPFLVKGRVDLKYFFWKSQKLYVFLIHNQRTFGPFILKLNDHFKGIQDALQGI